MNKLFKNTIISEEDQKRIKDYLNGGWSLDEWNRICNIQITHKDNLWTAVSRIKPRYGTEYLFGRWTKLPHSLLLAKAIKLAASIKEPEPWDELLLA